MDTATLIVADLAADFGDAITLEQLAARLAELAGEQPAPAWQVTHDPAEGPVRLVLLDDPDDPVVIDHAGTAALLALGAETLLAAARQRDATGASADPAAGAGATDAARSDFARLELPDSLEARAAGHRADPQLVEACLATAVRAVLRDAVRDRRLRPSPPADAATTDTPGD